MSKKKILIALPFGQSIRDVLRSDAYEELKSRDYIEIIVLSNASDRPEFQKEFGGPRIRFEVLSDYQPNRKELLCQSLYLSTLAFKSNTIKLYADNDKRSSLRYTIPISNIISKVIGRYNLQKLLGSILKASNRERSYRDLFDTYKPDLVVVTRVLRSSPDYPVLKEAAHRKLPVMALVSSWDNFTTKGFFPFGIKKLVVWNKVMRDEACELFGFPKKDIMMSGIPRFDNYFKRVGMCTKEEFFSRYGLDPKKKLVSYTTGNKTAVLSPGEDVSAEADIALFLAKSIESNKLKGVQLLVRLHPLADANDFSALKDMANVIVQVPGDTGIFRDRLFSKNDDMEIAETVCYSDLIINVASTMTIDAAVFDTPSISVAFDIRGKLPFEHSVKRYYEYEHYRKLRTTGGVAMVQSPEELLERVAMYLADPSIGRKERKRIIEQQCEYLDGMAGLRVGKYIHSYLDSL